MLLSMSGIEKRFGPTRALRGVDLSIQSGEVHAIVGENGAGKSTLMKILSGVEQPDAGNLLLEGQPFQPRNPREARQHGIVMIYQELALAGHLSVAENISLGNEPSRFGLLQKKLIRERALQTLKELGHPDIDPDMPAGRLPVATRQIIEIARAAASGCRILVLDEPTSSLAREDAHRLFALVRRLVTAGCAVLYISHVLEEVKELADRITVLRDGQTVKSARNKDFAVADMITSMAGRAMGELYPRSPHTPQEPVLEIAGLVTTRSAQPISLQLRQGEVLGIAGLIGAGRTELLRSLFGLDPVLAGDIRLAAFRGPAQPHQRLHQGMGMLSEDRRHEGLATALSVADNMTLSRFEARWGFFWPPRQQRTVRRWMQSLDIRARDPGQPVGTLSGGNQQKVALARLLHHDMDVFLLDEPTRGIDVASKARIYEIIDALATGDPAAGRPARAVLLVSSYIPELLGVCDRIAVMTRGQLGPARPVCDWTEHAILKEATGKVAA